MKRILLLVCVIAILFTISGCGSSQRVVSPDTSEKTAESGLIANNPNNQKMLDDAQSFLDSAQDVAQAFTAIGQGITTMTDAIAAPFSGGSSATTQQVTTPAASEQAPDMQTQSTGGGYQAILDEYSEKLRAATPGLIEEYKAEAAQNSGGLQGLATIATNKTTVLAGITTQGTQKMADEYLYHGSGDYNEYEAWAGKLNDVYMEESGKINDVYMHSFG